MPATRHLARHARPLEDLRVIKRRFGTTVNDVLLSASASALRGLLEDRDEPLCDIKAMVPVSVEDLDDRWGNRIAFLFLGLPCAEADPVWRLRDIHVAMRARKRDREPEAADAILGALALAPRPLRRLASRALASPYVSNLTISNIPGPRVPLYASGGRVESIYPVIPIHDRHALSIGVMTYDRGAYFACYADPRALPGVGRLADALEDAVAELETGSPRTRSTPPGPRRGQLRRHDLHLVEQFA
jgi:WS/DGAT/MGAT family acyltransferase